MKLSPEYLLHLFREQAREQGLPASIAPDSDFNDAHVAPYVLQTSTSKSMHFSFAATQSCLDLRHPNKLTLAYTRAMMGFLLFNPRPASIAMIGLGGGSLARFVHEYLPDTFMKVVEINPGVLDLRQEFMVPDDGDRFRIRLGNGAEFVQTPPRLFDVLLIDGFDLHGQPPELANLDFYLNCSSCLRPDGVLVANLHLGSEGFERQVEDLGAAFANNVCIVHDDECGNAVAFASKTPLRQLYRHDVFEQPPIKDRWAWAHLLPDMRAVANQIRQGGSGAGEKRR